MFFKKTELANSKNEGQLLNRNAFTLIELLAIIVILAIIAVITVPIILNIIENSRRGAAINSAYGYRDAINKFYVSKLLDDNNYVIENGEHDILYYVDAGLDVSGEKISDGWVMIESDNVTDFSIKIGDYAVTYNSKSNSIDAVKGGDIVLTPRAQAMKDAKDKVSAYITSVTTASNTKNYDGDKSFTVDEIVTELGVDKTTGFDDSSWVYFTYDSEVSSNKMSVTNYSFKVTEGDFTFIIERNSDGNPYITEKTSISTKVAALSSEFLNNIASYDDVEVVYYNPIDGIINCTDYDSDNSTPGYKGVVPETNTLGQTSCLKWYKYSTNTDETINMILDHNIEVGKLYYDFGDGQEDNRYGPFSLMQYLTLSEWDKVPTRSDKYIAYVDNGTSKKVKFTNATGNAVNYSGKKARLITAQEIAEITGASSTTSPGISWNEQILSSDEFYLDSKNRSTARSSSNPSDYYWLFENLKDCEQYGCINQYQNIASGNFGYWTSSPNAGNFVGAWIMGWKGMLYGHSVRLPSNGVRPVITVSNS